jgi:hypothetical protein
MDVAGTLEAIAEVGVALAGFAALVALFRGGADSWTPAAISALRFMIELSLCILVFALLPSPLLLSGLSAPAVWLTASSSMLVVATVLFVLNVQRIRSLLHQGWRPPRWGFHIVGFSLGGLVLASQGLNLYLHGAALYVSGLLGIILLVGLQFLAFVAGGRGRQS